MSLIVFGDDPYDLARELDKEQSEHRRNLSEKYVETFEICNRAASLLATAIIQNPPVKNVHQYDVLMTIAIHGVRTLRSIYLCIQAGEEPPSNKQSSKSAKIRKAR